MKNSLLKNKVDGVLRPKRGNTPKGATRPRATAPKKSAVARAPNGKFLKGSSGNPSGRPIIAHEIRELAGEHSAEALQVIVSIMRDAKADKSVRLVAAKAVLDRAVGKPMQPIAGGLNGGALVNINMGGATLATAEDAAAVYRELCGDPSLDVSALRLAAPAPPPAVEREPVTIEADHPLAPATEAANHARAVWERLAADK